MIIRGGGSSGASSRARGLEVVSVFSMQKESCLFTPFTLFMRLARLAGAMASSTGHTEITVSRVLMCAESSEWTEKVKKCSSSWANQEKCAVGVRMYATYRAPLGASL